MLMCGENVGFIFVIAAELSQTQDCQVLLGKIVFEILELTFAQNVNISQSNFQIAEIGSLFMTITFSVAFKRRL